ncbi:hypothetical protein PR003_g16094 [Phytophthora rubi]|uniref:Uncharacterized protein n=1 Tax=Phytophthora rubi TaxID=129364 RepID=A0A6A4F0D7_9STRA|nr:hypothetical protein PR003_g16094 [Phytophthora rubi]
MARLDHGESRAEHVREAQDAEVHAPGSFEGYTLKKHMFGLEDVVRRIVKQRFSGQKRGFAVDVWTEDGNHFIAIIAIT